MSKSLGEWTQVLESYGENVSNSYQQNGGAEQGRQISRGSSLNYSLSGRALLRPEEILTLSNDCVIVLQRGLDPILAQRVKWYQDRDFNPAMPKWRKKSSQRHKWTLLMFAVLLVTILWAWLTA